MEKNLSKHFEKCVFEQFLKFLGDYTQKLWDVTFFPKKKLICIERRKKHAIIFENHGMLLTLKP
jgi:hypothetical protein